MTTKKTTKKTTTGAKTAKTTSPSEKRIKAEKPVELIAKPAKATLAVVVPEVKVAPAVAAMVETTPAPVVDAKPSRVVPQHEVQQLVREAAFLFAKRREFRNGTPTQDWLAAEAFVNQRLAERGFTVSP